MTLPLRCDTCKRELAQKDPRVLCADYAWRCMNCANPLVHPRHAKDAGVAVRVALGVLLVGLLIALLKWVGP